VKKNYFCTTKCIHFEIHKIKSKQRETVTYRKCTSGYPLPSLTQRIMKYPMKKKKETGNNSRSLQKTMQQRPFLYHLKRMLFCWVLVDHACNPSYLGGWDWEFEASLGKQLMRHPPHLQNNQSKMDWKCGLSLQVWSPEFKPQSHQKKEKERGRFCDLVNILEKLWILHVQSKQKSGSTIVIFPSRENLALIPTNRFILTSPKGNSKHL
jgi:hypothetical protein